jgi:RNA polymerase sigma-70 factor (ECF subfamily)
MASPAGWTYRVALNLVRRHHQHRGREQAIPMPRDATTVPTSDPAVWEAVRKLPTRQRDAVLLRYVADFSEAEIADVMSIRRGTVASTLAAARRTLSEELIEDLQEETP